jgi:hypothetical protein
VLDRDGHEWKYDLRLLADRSSVIGAAARVFQGQVVGMRNPGSGFAPVRIVDNCCLLRALATTGVAPGLLNISKSGRIYHMLGSRDYDETQIDREAVRHSSHHA